MTQSEMIEKLKQMLTPKRFHHSMGVRSTAAELARRYGADVEKCEIAGLLHDCAKNMPKETMVKMCDELGVYIDDETRSQLSLVHANLGAKLCETEFGVTDPEILNAVLYHTLGRPNMTLIEKIIYLSDAVEPTRVDHEGLSELRKLVLIDLDEAVYFSSVLTINFVKSKGLPLHSQTYETRDYYCNISKKPLASCRVKE